MPNTKLSIINAAMARAGHSKVLIEGDSAPEWSIIDRNYDLIVGAAFEQLKPNFGKARRALTTRSAGDFGFDDKWLLGSDVMHVTRIFFGDYPWEGDWETDGEYLYINRSSNVEIEFIRNGAEGRWSQTFADAVADMIASLIESAVNEEDDEAAAFEQRGQGKMLLSGHLSGAAQASKRPFRRSFLMRQRFYGRGRFSRRGDE